MMASLAPRRRIDPFPNCFSIWPKVRVKVRPRSFSSMIFLRFRSAQQAQQTCATGRADSSIAAKIAVEGLFVRLFFVFSRWLFRHFAYERSSLCEHAPPGLGGSSL